ncbi:MAG: alpha/beta hydrolase [Anaerolineae bacterium]|nr:alpha/beta hydrolase [Anaerolineae bacterium]
MGAQEAQAALSINSRLEIVDGAAHFIQWSHPQAVIDAVATIIESIQTGTTLNRKPIQVGKIPCLSF